MSGQQHKVILIADSTLNNFAGYLANDVSSPAIEVTIAPFGQVLQVLLNHQLDCWQAAPDLGVVWTRPEAVIDGFNRVLQFEPVDLSEILSEVDAYCDALRSVQSRLKYVFVPTWVLANHHRGFGALDLRTSGGVTSTLMAMNLRLVQNLSDTPNCIVLDAQKWISGLGQKALSPKLWYMGKIPFSNEVFKEAVRDFKAAVRGLNGQAKKLIILDLDNTLWSGIVGDVGWQGLVLGGHDPVGEALVDFQRGLKALKNRGILLAVVSKNEESVALDAIEKHPEMVLRQEDFAGWRINWEDKAKNVAELVAELNLGLDSVVFIDDNPVERARVAEALPSVLVPEWPQDKLLYRQALFTLDCFDSGVVSSEDRARSTMYKAERDRTLTKNRVASLDEWLETLGTQVSIELLNQENLPRVTQLLNKTNQMNLRTRRLASTELASWAAQGHCRLFAFRVADKFGDSGLTGILGLEAHGDALHITDFILSCRVMGRRIENAMISLGAEYGRSRGLKRLRAEYLKTEKNKPCLDFFQQSGLRHAADDSFTWDLSEPYPLPHHLQVQNEILCTHSTT
jgi:FkbH-like protein